MVMVVVEALLGLVRGGRGGGARGRRRLGEEVLALVREARDGLGRADDVAEGRGRVVALLRRLLALVPEEHQQDRDADEGGDAPDDAPDDGGGGEAGRGRVGVLARRRLDCSDFPFRCRRRGFTARR